MRVILSTPEPDKLVKYMLKLARSRYFVADLRLNHLIDHLTVWIGRRWLQTDSAMRNAIEKLLTRKYIGIKGLDNWAGKVRDVIIYDFHLALRLKLYGFIDRINIAGGAGLHYSSSLPTRIDMTTEKDCDIVEQFLCGRWILQQYTQLHSVFYFSMKLKRRAEALNARLLMCSTGWKRFATKACVGDNDTIAALARRQWLFQFRIVAGCFPTLLRDRLASINNRNVAANPAFQADYDKITAEIRRNFECGVPAVHRALTKIYTTAAINIYEMARAHVPMLCMLAILDAAVPMAAVEFSLVRRTKIVRVVSDALVDACAPRSRRNKRKRVNSDVL